MNLEPTYKELKGGSTAQQIRVAVFKEPLYSGIRSLVNMPPEEVANRAPSKWQNDDRMLYAHLIGFRKALLLLLELGDPSEPFSHGLGLDDDEIDMPQPETETENP